LLLPNRIRHDSAVRSTGTLFSLAAGAAFGAMAIFAKLAYGDGTTVGTLLSVRFTLAALGFWALLAVAGGVRQIGTLPRRDLAAGLALGACGYALQSGLYFTALTRIDASLLSLLLYTFPAMVATAAVALGRERLDARRVIALGLALSGLVLVVAGAGTGGLDAVGVVLGIGAAIVYSTYILVSDGVVGRVSPLALATLVSTGAAVALTAGSATIGELDLGAVSAAGWGWLVCLAAVSTVAAIVFFFAGLRRVGPTTASILNTVEPLVTVLLAFAVFGERLGVVQMVGGALVLSAVLALHARWPITVREATAAA
jgi:drug/metabolite transporter (DMT)-like permease